MIDRPVDHLPDLSSDYSITGAMRESFARDGHIYLPGIATTEEINAYRPVITAAAQRYNTETRQLEDRDTYGKAFLQIMNLWTKDEGVKRFAFAKRFAKIAAELMNVSGVRMYHDQALYKEPGGGATPYHQDQFYWPLDTPHTITMWMPLVDITSEIGSMTFVSGSHRLGYLDKLPISDESQSEFQKLISGRGLSTHTYGAMRAGDATFHAGWTLHSAPANPTNRMREVMTIIYMAADARVVAPDHPNREADLATWMPGIKPGEIAASPLNPILWQK
ncbi:MAG: phytanoyl-CoA dioxygenase family protein [Acidobacteriota bacterium]